MKNKIYNLILGGLVLTQSSWATAAACPQTSPQFVGNSGSVSCANAVRSANASGSFTAVDGTISVDLGLGNSGNARALNSQGNTIVSCGTARDTSPGFGVTSSGSTITRAACKDMRFIHLTVT